MSESSKIRLNKYLCQWGGVSRRQADECIKKGLVSLNNAPVTKLGLLVDPKKDQVRLKKKWIRPSSFSPRYILFHKPEKVLTTTKDPKNRATVMDFMRKSKQRVFPVGRLDWNSEGLLLLTNDGDFAQKILHPKNKVAKTYLVKVQGQPSFQKMKKLLKGVSTPLGKMRALYIAPMSKTKQQNLWVKIIISEGRNQQIRRMVQSLGYRVNKLKRVAIGRLKLSNLKKGHSLLIKKSEVQKVFILPKEIAHKK